MSFLKSITLWPNQWMFLSIYSLILAYVYSIGDSLPIIAVVSMVFSGLFAADLSVKTYQEFFGDRSLIGGIENYAVMVTGCDTGFGLHFAQRLAKLGFLVYATVLFPDGKGAQKLKKYDNIVVLRLDITRQDEVDGVVRTLAADLTKRKKTFWSLVNNAGVALYSDIEVAPMEHFQRVMEVNAFGPLRLCKAILPLMRANNRGRIVNITSLSGHFTIPFTTAYSMSKHALISLSDGLRGEVKPWNISVHTIQPAFYQTSENFFEDQVQVTIKHYHTLWEQSPEHVQKAIGLQFRDARVQALNDVCGQNARPIDKIDEVADEMVDAVAGVAPQICYTPRTLTKIGGRIIMSLPTELQDLIISPKVTGVPAQLAARKTSSIEDYPKAAHQLTLSLVWHYAKLAFNFVLPSSGTLLKRT